MTNKAMYFLNLDHRIKRKRIPIKYIDEIKLSVKFQNLLDIRFDKTRHVIIETYKIYEIC